MTNKYISDEAWSKIFNFLKTVKNIYTKSESACRSFVEAVIWITRTGAQWRELPEKYGQWNTIFRRFNEWSKKQIWHLVHTSCIENPDLEYVMIDATIVRAHACAAGYNDQESEGLGRSKGGFTTKIHTTVDALGNPLEFVITPGQRNDITQANTLLSNVSGCHVIGDKGYSSKELRTNLIQQNCIPVIPSRSNSKEPAIYDEHIYKERHAIECLFSKIKYFRRVFSRFDKSARNFVSHLSLVGALIWLR
jgi:transposase